MVDTIFISVDIPEADSRALSEDDAWDGHNPRFQLGMSLTFSSTAAHSVAAIATEQFTIMRGDHSNAKNDLAIDKRRRFDSRLLNASDTFDSLDANSQNSDWVLQGDGILTIHNFLEFLSCPMKFLLTPALLQLAVS